MVLYSKNLMYFTSESIRDFPQINQAPVIRVSISKYLRDHWKNIFSVITGKAFFGEVTCLKSSLDHIHCNKSIWHTPMSSFAQLAPQQRDLSGALFTCFQFSVPFPAPGSPKTTSSIICTSDFNLVVSGHTQQTLIRIFSHMAYLSSHMQMIFSTELKVKMPKSHFFQPSANFRRYWHDCENASQNLKMP